MLTKDPNGRLRLSLATKAAGSKEAEEARVLDPFRGLQPGDLVEAVGKNLLL